MLVCQTVSAGTSCELSMEIKESTLLLLTTACDEESWVKLFKMKLPINVELGTNEKEFNLSAIAVEQRMDS